MLAYIDRWNYIFETLEEPEGGIPHDEEDAPLTPSYHPPMSPGMKRATGRSGTSVGDEGPLRSGRWMLRRSEYLKQWYKRWVVLDTSGALITFTSTPKDDAAISTVAVSDVRCAPDRLRAARPTTPSPRAREPSRQRNTGVERNFPRRRPAPR